MIGRPGMPAGPGSGSATSRCNAVISTTPGRSTGTQGGIAERLARADPANAGWQRNLSVSYNKIGDVLVAQGNLPEALKAYRDSRDIAERLARADPANAGWQRD